MSGARRRATARHRRRRQGAGAHRAPNPFPATGVRARDHLRAAAAAIAARPARSALTSVGTVLGIAALVATIGLTSTAQAQIADAFAEMATNELAVRALDAGAGPTEAFPAEAVARVAARPGVRSAGLLYQLEDSTATLTSQKYGGAGEAVNLYAADPAALDGVGISLRSGRLPDTGNERRADRALALSDHMADRLGLGAGGDPVVGETVLLGGVPYAVLGVYDDVRAHSELLLGAVVPVTTARRLDPTTAPRLVVRTDPGAAQAVAARVATVLDPALPERYAVMAAPEPERLRDKVDASVRNLLLLLAAVALAVSGLGIANTTLMAVMERAGEIGLRRAVGARRRHIAVQFVIESGLLGLCGAVVGVWLGLMVTVWASVARGWEPVLDLRPFAIGPAVGLLVGVMAGLYPALRAAAMEPATVLKR